MTLEFKRKKHLQRVFLHIPAVGVCLCVVQFDPQTFRSVQAVVDLSLWILLFYFDEFDLSDLVRLCTALCLVLYK